MKIILDFVTNSSESDYYDCSDCRDDCSDCRDDCSDCDCDCDCDDCRDCDCDCDCDDCRDCDCDCNDCDDCWIPDGGPAPWDDCEADPDICCGYDH